MAPSFRPNFLRRSSDTAAGGPDEDPGIDGADSGEDSDGEEWLAYELHEWSLESRVMLKQLLTVDQVVHSWQGTTLMVHESLEETVDSLVGEVEEAESAKEAINRPIGPEDDLTAFEVGDWSQAMRDELVERLVQAKVPHILEQTSVSGAGSGVDVGSVGEAVSGVVESGEDAGSGVDVGSVGEAVSGVVESGEDAGSGVDVGSVGEAVSGVVESGEDAGSGVDVGSVGEAVSGVVESGEDAGSGVDVGSVGEAVSGVVESGEDAGSGVDVGSGEDAGGWDLWVREADEERVDLVIDDMLARLEEENFVELDGLDLNDLLSDLFLACDRLRRDPGDLDGLRGAVAGARRIAGVRTPFGFSAPNWRSLRNAAGELLALVEAEDTDAEELRDLAHRLSDSLRMLI